MIHPEHLTPELIRCLEQQGLDFNRLEIPPPAFIAMQGKVQSFNLEEKQLCCRFPVLTEQLNPYGVMQGGIIAAAIDNTIGPLSMLVAPPSFTRNLEVKYRKTIEASFDYIYVTARYIDQKKRFLYFEAEVEDLDHSICYATAKAIHWIM